VNWMARLGSGAPMLTRGELVVLVEAALLLYGRAAEVRRGGARSCGAAASAAIAAQVVVDEPAVRA